MNVCTSCYHRVGKHYSTNNYCSNCGSKLDWSIADSINKNMTPREKAIAYCKNKTTTNEDYLSSLLHNLYALEHGLEELDEYEGCPQNYGLDPCEELCELEEVYDDKEQTEQCKKCWLMALHES